MGYFSRHFCKRRPARVEGKEAPTRVPLLLDEIIPEPVPTDPAWTVTAPNRPALTVRADSETAARKAARESWGLARLPNGTEVSPA
jgi:hypothetical protein